jgi:hypothetical protein
MSDHCVVEGLYLTHGLADAMPAEVRALLLRLTVVRFLAAARRHEQWNYTGVIIQTLLEIGWAPSHAHVRGARVSTAIRQGLSAASRPRARCACAIPNHAPVDTA